MKTRVLQSMMFLAGVGAAALPAQEVDLGFLKGLETKAAESTMVDLGPEQLGMLKDFAGGAGIPEAGGIKSVRVRSFEFDKKGMYNMAELETFRAKVKGSGNWTSLISVKERGGEFTEIMMHRAPNGDSDGMLIIAVEEEEVTVVNIVGKVDLKNLGKIAGRLGIPEMTGDPDRGKEKEKEKDSNRDRKRQEQEDEKDNF